MKTISLTFLLIIWFAFTLIFLCTLVGMVLFIPDSYGDPSSWMKIGLDIKNKLLE